MPDKVIGGFASFIDRKSREATAAELPPYTTDLERPLDGMLAIGSPWTERLFDGPFYLSPLPQRLPACHLVFVQSLDGNTGARNPQALGGGETDKHVIYEGLARVSADAVLAGSSTVRGGSLVFSVWHPELVRFAKPLASRVIRSRNRRHTPRCPHRSRASLQHSRASCRPPDRARWNRRHARGARRASLDHAYRRRHRPQLIDAFEQLRAMGIQRISAVGGRDLAAHLIDAGLVQDLYLTTSPVTGGEPGTPMYSRPLELQTVVRKRGTLHEAGVVFEHSVLRST